MRWSMRTRAQGTRTLCHQCSGAGLVDVRRCCRVFVTLEESAYLFMVSPCQAHICPVCDGEEWLAGLVPPI